MCMDGVESCGQGRLRTGLSQVVGFARGEPRATESESELCTCVYLCTCAYMFIYAYKFSVRASAAAAHRWLRRRTAAVC
jgi:hypothetical protein